MNEAEKRAKLVELQAQREQVEYDMNLADYEQMDLHDMWRAAYDLFDELANDLDSIDMAIEDIMMGGE